MKNTFKWGCLLASSLLGQGRFCPSSPISWDRKCVLKSIKESPFQQSCASSNWFRPSIPTRWEGSLFDKHFKMGSPQSQPFASSSKVSPEAPLQPSVLGWTSVLENLLQSGCPLVSSLLHWDGFGPQAEFAGKAIWASIRWKVLGLSRPLFCQEGSRFHPNLLGEKQLLIKS